MKLFKDLTGLKFGKLLAIKRVFPSKNGQAVWFCKCDCGQTSTVRI